MDDVFTQLVRDFRNAEWLEPIPNKQLAGKSYSNHVIT